MILFIQKTCIHERTFKTSPNPCPTLPPHRTASTALMVDFVARYLDQHIRDAGAMGKPLLVEEYGQVANRTAADILARRDPIFKLLFTASLYGPGKPLKGSLFWQFHLPVPDSASNSGPSRIVTVQDSTWSLIQANAQQLHGLATSSPAVGNCVPGQSRSFEGVKSGSTVYISRGPGFVVLSLRNGTTTGQPSPVTVSSCAQACNAAPGCTGFTFSIKVCLLLSSALSLDLNPPASSPVLFLPGAQTFVRVNDVLTRDLGLSVADAVFVDPAAAAAAAARARELASQPTGLLPPPGQDAVIQAEIQLAKNRTAVALGMSRLSLFADELAAAGPAAAPPLSAIPPAPEQVVSAERPSALVLGDTLGGPLGVVTPTEAAAAVTHATPAAAAAPAEGPRPSASGGLTLARPVNDTAAVARAQANLRLPETPLLQEGTPLQEAPIAEDQLTPAAGGIVMSSAPAAANQPTTAQIQSSATPMPEPVPGPGPEPAPLLSSAPVPAMEPAPTPAPAPAPVTAPSPTSTATATAPTPTMTPSTPASTATTTLTTASGSSFVGANGFVAVTEGTTLPPAGAAADYLTTSEPTTCAESCASQGSSCTAFSFNQAQGRCYLKTGTDPSAGVEASPDGWTTFFATPPAALAAGAAQAGGAPTPSARVLLARAAGGRPQSLGALPLNSEAHFRSVATGPNPLQPSVDIEPAVSLVQPTATAAVNQGTALGSVAVSGAGGASARPPPPDFVAETRFLAQQLSVDPLGGAPSLRSQMAARRADVTSQLQSSGRLMSSGPGAGGPGTGPGTGPGIGGPGAGGPGADGSVSADGFGQRVAADARSRGQDGEQGN